MKSIRQRPTGTAARFFLDILVLVNFILITSTGLVLYFILPHGSRHLGSRGGIRHGVKTLWDMDRQKWGNIHLILSLIFLTICLFHVIQHWSWIKGFFIKKMTAGPRLATLIILTLTLVVSVLPFLAQTTIVGGPGDVVRDAAVSSTSDSPSRHQASPSGLSVRGSDTIESLARQLGVSTLSVKQAMGLSPETHDGMRMSHVKHQRGLHMSDLRKLLERCKPSL